jgi:hypothetical protein
VPDLHEIPKNKPRKGKLLYGVGPDEHRSLSDTAAPHWTLVSCSSAMSAFSANGGSVPIHPCLPFSLSSLLLQV